MSKNKILKVLKNLQEKVLEEDDWETINPPQLFRFYMKTDVEQAIKQIKELIS